MAFVTCPSCGERGKIPSSLIGSRIKCKKCGVSFTVSSPAAKAAAAAGSTGSATAVATTEGIEVEGLDASAWSLSTETSGGLKAEASAEPDNKSDSSSPFAQAGPASGQKEYKLLTPRDKIFDGRFDLARLEEALNHFGRQGWTVRAMLTPHVKGFTGALEETIVVLLER
ncbi:MAG: DUF4177 domain-containing protein [Isosphaeraceae bacterium]